MRIRNPWPMVGTLEKCWLLTFQTPKKDVEHYLPSGFSLIDFESKKGADPNRAYWNVVVCQIGGMRPRYFPAWAGIRYWHVAYRLYVRVEPKGREPIDGLYFVRSDCNSLLIATMGNILTDFKFNKAEVHVQQDRGGALKPLVAVEAPGASIRFSIDSSKPVPLAEDSIFSSPEEAANVLAYKPFGLAPQRDGFIDVLAIKRDEAQWKYSLITIQDEQFEFFKDKQVRFEVGYELAPIKYQWNPGQLFELKG